MATQTPQEFLEELYLKATPTKLEAVSQLMSVFLLDRYYAEKELEQWYRRQLEESFP